MLLIYYIYLIDTLLFFTDCSIGFLSVTLFSLSDSVTLTGIYYPYSIHAPASSTEDKPLDNIPTCLSEPVEFAESLSENKSIRSTCRSPCRDDHMHSPN